MIKKWINSLQVQTLLLLTAALLPLGAVAIYQTNQVANAAQRNAELALLALTEQAAQAEEVMIQHAIGAASFVASLAPRLIEDPQQCSAYMSQFITAQQDYSFIGIIPLSGLMTCSSAQEDYDFSGFANFQRNIAVQKRSIEVNKEAPLSGISVFIVSEPFYVAGDFAGFVSVSIPHRGLPEFPVAMAEMGLIDLLTLNDEGTILTARTDIESAATVLPSAPALTAFDLTEGVVFQSEGADGRPHVYTAVPIEGSPATVLGVWQVGATVVGLSPHPLRATTFPILMWLASMSVAMLSIYILVLRHLSRLQRRMDRFAETRDVSPTTDRLAMPNELQALQVNFDNMAQDILRDEAGMENAMREKNVLIKEIHHRVKNNLQLISSIMNMQIRQAEHVETKSALSRLQDRVLSLATIHRDLYQSQDAGKVQVGAMISETVDNSVEVAIEDRSAVEVTTDIDPVLLFPDQAVPLSLLTAEGMVNAAKYVGAPADQKPWLHVSLKQDNDNCVLTLANAIAGNDTSAESTGMGAQLINAFAMQLGGDINIDQSHDSYTMTVTFPVRDFEPDARDY